MSTKGIGTGMNKTTEDEILEEAFNMFDKDNSGCISREEFGTVSRAIGLNPSDKEIEEILKKYDTNDSKRIEFHEFKNLITELKLKHKNDEVAIRNAFALFDHDKSGFIEAAELKEILKKCGQFLSDEEVKEMIDVADVDQDGKINYKEFTKFICKPIK